MPSDITITGWTLVVVGAHVFSFSPKFLDVRSGAGTWILDCARAWKVRSLLQCLSNKMLTYQLVPFRIPHSSVGNPIGMIRVLGV